MRYANDMPMTSQHDSMLGLQIESLAMLLRPASRDVLGCHT